VKFVFNSSPLIFLARLNFLETFVDASDEFYLPDAVNDEIKAKQDESSEYIQRLINHNRLEVRVTNLVSLASSMNARLGKGEAEAIALGTELQANYVVLDDFAARREAMRLGLNVRGTLAVIRRLHSEGTIAIDNLNELYQQLMAINFRVKRSLFDAIFED
jgi:predicted nucleic acid-binding protein